MIRNELTYLHGILYLEANETGNKWVFESVKSSFQSKDYKDICKDIAEVFSRGTLEALDQAKQLTDANNWACFLRYRR